MRLLNSIAVVMKRRQRFIIICTTLPLLAFVLYAGRTLIVEPSIHKTVNSMDDSKVHSNGILPGRSGNRLQLFDIYRDINLENDDRIYFQQVGSAHMCYIAGTDVEATLESNSTSCICKEDYYGNECGIPSAAWLRSVKKRYRKSPLKPRQIPRRIIYSIHINDEMNLFQARLEELQDVVDAYIVSETNYTVNGGNKPCYLLEKLNKGFMQPFHKKMVYLQLTHFPEKGKGNQSIIDMYAGDFVGSFGLQRIHNVKGDDLFIQLDANEIPMKEILLFLKLYDGYSEPIRLAMKWSVYGFFWKKKRKTEDSVLDWLIDEKQQGKEELEDLIQVYAVCTMAMLWEVYDNNTSLIRNDVIHTEEYEGRLRKYKKRGHRISPWSIGRIYDYAGYHCSWCYTAEDIRRKLLSNNTDNKLQPEHLSEQIYSNNIENMIENGEWFNGTQPFIIADWEKDEQYAPSYMLQYPELFVYLLYPPKIRRNII